VAIGHAMALTNHIECVFADETRRHYELSFSGTIATITFLTRDYPVPAAFQLPVDAARRLRGSASGATGEVDERRAHLQ